MENQEQNQVQIQEPTLLTEQPICILNTINALNEVILSDLLQHDEKQIIKIIRFKQWLSDLSKK